MRPFAFVVLAVGTAAAAIAACDSFEEGNASAAPDGAADDATNDAGLGVADGASNDAKAGTFCEGKRDAGFFCFDFDTDPLTPTWVPVKDDGDGGGTATIVVDDAASASPPNAASFTIKQTATGLIQTSAVLTRSAEVDIASGAIELDVAIEEVSATSTLAYAVVSSTQDGAIAGCFFGVNAAVQGGASLYVTSKAADGGFLTKSTPPDVLSNKFTHVTLEWLPGPPPKVKMTVGGATYELPADDCVRSTAYAISFGPQTEIAPVDARMRIDNIAYEFKP